MMDKMQETVEGYGMRINVKSTRVMNSVKGLASVVQRLDTAIHRINLYPVDSAISFPNTYPLDSDLSGG